MQKVASLTRSQLRLLSVSGQHIINRHQQLVRLIRTRLGREDVALLLTDPQVNPANNEIVWYTSLRGPVARLADLPAKRQEVVRAVFAEQAAELRRLAAELREAGPAGTHSDADVIDALLRVPDEATSLYVCSDQPLLVGWACEWAAPDRSPVDLVSSLRPKAAPPLPVAEPPMAATVLPSASAVVPVQRSGPWGWLLWLLNLLLLAFIIFLLLHGCERLSGVGAVIPPQADTVSAAPDPKEQALRREIADLELQAAKRQQDCRPAPPQQPVPLPVRKVEPPKPVDPPKPVERNLVIPGEAQKKNDMSFLEGCWQSITSLTLRNDDTPLEMEYCFNAAGRGTATVHVANSSACHAPATARFNGNSGLLISVPQNLSCQIKGRRTGIQRWDIACTANPDGVATCEGRHPDGGTFGVQMRRK